MLSAGDFQDLAYLLIDAHGAEAVIWADRAIAELYLQGDEERAELWRMLRSVACDMIAGRIDPHRRPTLH
ncbi:MAG: hypothetical protein U1F24_00075 [Alphaproteobacteria bacterium]|jgi:hypothetical protein